MSGTVDAGLVPSIEKDTITTSSESAPVETVSSTVADSKVNLLSHKKTLLFAGTSS